MNSQGMKNCRSTESMSRDTNYLNKWLVHFLTYLLLPCLFFSAAILNLCKPRTTLFLLCRAGLPRLAFYGKGLACSPSWLRMVIAGWLGSMRSEIFLQMKFIIFQGCPTKQVAFLAGQPTPYDQRLIQAFLLFACSRILICKKCWN